MRRLTAILACALALASCGKKETTSAPDKRKVTTTVIPEDERGAKKKVFVKPAPDILEKSLLGSKLAPDGTVFEEKSTFKPGEPVALTIWLKQSPPGLATSVTWFDAKGNRVGHEQRAMNGEKMTTYRLAQKLPPGQYRVEGYWGGNVVADKSFEVKK